MTAALQAARLLRLKAMEDARASGDTQRQHRALLRLQAATLAALKAEVGR